MSKYWQLFCQIFFFFENNEQLNKLKVLFMISEKEKKNKKYGQPHGIMTSQQTNGQVRVFQWSNWLIFNDTACSLRIVVSPPCSNSSIKKVGS